MKNLFTILFSFIVLLVLAQADIDHVIRGNEFYRQSKFDQAELHYREAIKINPNNFTARHNLGNTLMQQKKYTEANTIYGEVIAGADKDLKAIAYYNNGVSYTKQKELESSIEAYKDALRINPADTDARENLQKALSELKNQKGGGGGQEKNKADQSEADKKLKQLEQKEQNAQKRLRKHSGTGGGGKDW